MAVPSAQWLHCWWLRFTAVVLHAQAYDAPWLILFPPERAWSLYGSTCLEAPSALWPVVRHVCLSATCVWLLMAHCHKPRLSGGHKGASMCRQCYLTLNEYPAC